MPEPRWLSDDEQQAWREFSVAMKMLREHLEGQLQHEAGMPHTYYEVLASLSEAPGRQLRMSELAEVSHSSRSRLSHAIARLEANGWVRRESCPTDKRGAWALLTDSGFAVLEKAAPGHVEAVRQSLFDALTDEQVISLREISAAIRAKLAPQCEAAKVADEISCVEQECETLDEEKSDAPVLSTVD